MMRVASRLTTATVLAGFLLAQIVPAAAFAQAAKPQPTVAQPSRVQVAPAQMLRALFQSASKNAAFTSPRRSGVGEESETPLTEADAREAISGVAQMLISSMNALAGGLAITAHEFSQVSRELATAEVVVPARQAQNVFVSGTSYISNLFLGMPVRATLNASRAGTGAGLTLGSSDSSFVIMSAHAAEPQDAEWNELAAETDKLKRQFNTEVMLQFFQPPIKRQDMYAYARGARDALVAAADAATARNGANAVRALESAVGALTGFMERFPGERGAALYAGFENLLPRALYALVLARMLESGGTSPPREEILSDPKAMIYRAEQIGAEETARKAAGLRKKLQDVETQLAKNPDAKLLLLAEELRGAIKNLDRLTKAIPFAMQQIKEPTLSCSSLDTNSILREVKKFAVATEVSPLLEIYKKGLIAEAVEKIRKYYAGKIPASGIDGIIARAMDASQTFQSADDQRWYNPDMHWYQPLPGRLRYGSGSRPNQAVAGIFGVAYGGISKRIQEIQMVGAYMAEDAFARFAADCTKPPSTVIQETIDRLARYIKATSALSSESATAMVREEFEKIVKEYEGGLAAVLNTLDTEVYGNVRDIIGNLDTVNRGWTAAAPDVTKLLAEVRATLLALKALGLQTTTWIDDIEAVITRQPGKTKPPTSKTLSITCPTKSSEGKDCALKEPAGRPEFYDVCKLFGLPGYSIDPHPKPVDTCTNGNKIYTGRCCKSPECTHQNPDPVWGTGGLPRAALDDYWTFIGIANSDESAARRVERCTMNLATDPNTPFEQRPGCVPLQATMDRGLGALCDWNLQSAPVPMDGPAVNACPTGSVAEQEKLLSLLSKCVTKEEKDRVSLAFVWEQAKRFLKEWFLEFLQGEMDNLPKTLTADTQSILLGFLDKSTANALKSSLARGYNAGNSRFVASVVKYDRMLRAAIKRIRFTATTFAPMWGVSGPKVVDRSSNDAYRGITEHVFNAVFAEARRVLEPVFAEIEAEGMTKGIFSDELLRGDYITAAAAAARAAMILNIARRFDALWEKEGASRDIASLSSILASAIRETRQDAKAGTFLPLGLPSMAAESNLLRKAGIKLGSFDLHAFLDKITNPEQSTLPVKELFAVASAIDRVTDALKKLAEKDVEFSESVTACVSGMDSGKAIGDTLKKINNALPEEKDIENTYGREVVRELRNLQRGLQSLERSADGKKGDMPPTPFDDALDEVFRNVADRLAREVAAALRREQGVIRNMKK